MKRDSEVDSIRMKQGVARVAGTQFSTDVDINNPLNE